MPIRTIPLREATVLRIYCSSSLKKYEHRLSFFHFDPHSICERSFSHLDDASMPDRVQSKTRLKRTRLRNVKTARTQLRITSPPCP